MAKTHVSKKNLSVKGPVGLGPRAKKANAIHFCTIRKGLWNFPHKFHRYLIFLLGFLLKGVNEQGTNSSDSNCLVFMLKTINAL